MIRNKPNIGILGGGQLGRMLIQAAHEMEEDYKCIVWEPSKNACAFEVADEAIIKPYDDKNALEEFIKKVDKVVLEFENIPVEIVKEIERSGKLVAPSSEILSIVQDRNKEKIFFKKNKIPCADWHVVDSGKSALEAGRNVGYPLVLKTSRFGYDGKGQIICHDSEDVLQAWKELKEVTCIAEQFIPFEKEASIIGARNGKGEMVFYDIAENFHSEGILNTSDVPAILSDRAIKRARKYIENAMVELDIIGLLALELFVRGDEILANEMAARPHNSGHWTMDGAKTSQFEQCIRATTGLPFGSHERTHDVSMENLLGLEVSHLEDTLELEGYDKAIVHNYEKGEVREGRKMGHVNYTKEKTE